MPAYTISIDVDATDPYAAAAVLLDVLDPNGEHIVTVQPTYSNSNGFCDWSFAISFETLDAWKRATA